MKKNVVKISIMNKALSLFLLVLVAFTHLGCEYEEVLEGDYPEPMVYLPARKGTIDISKVDMSQTPNHRFDFANRKMIIPIGVYRSGITEMGDATVSISQKPEVVNNLGLPNVMLLPAERVQLPASVTLGKGSSSAPFEAQVDLDFLLQNMDKTFAFAIQVASEQVKVNEKLNTVVVQVNPAFFTPTANFTFATVAAEPLTRQFNNTSTNALSHTWDFGDGSTSTEVSPKYQFKAPGTYNVTLTTRGVVGEAMPAVVTKPVVVN